MMDRLEVLQLMKVPKNWSWTPLYDSTTFLALRVLESVDTEVGGEFGSE